MDEGYIVRLKYDPQVIGVIVDVDIWGEKFLVRIGNGDSAYTTWFWGWQLIPVGATGNADY